MESRLPLMWRGKEWGSLSWRDQSVRALFSLCCPSPGPGMYKVYLEGPQGRILLGTPIPEGSCLTLGRTLTYSALRSCGVFPPLRGVLELADQGGGEAPEGWSCLRPDHFAPWEEEVSRPLLEQPRLWCREEGNNTTVAVPWELGQCFPIPALFCFARLEKVQGLCCLLFDFDEKGRPRFGKPKPGN